MKSMRKTRRLDRLRIVFGAWLGAACVMLGGALTGIAQMPEVVYVDQDYTAEESGGHVWNYDAFASVQSGVASVATGGIVNVASGLYAEQVTIDKRLHLVGAGSGAVAGSSTIVSNSAWPVVKITANGLGDGDRLLLGDLRVTGATGGNQANSAIQIADGGSYLTLTNVAVVGNATSGIRMDTTSRTVTNIVFQSCHISGNSHIGLNQLDTVKVRGMRLEDCALNTNNIGFYSSGDLTGLTVDGGTFIGNTDSGFHSLKFNSFTEKEPMVMCGFKSHGNKRGAVIRYWGPFTISDASISGNKEEGLSGGPSADIAGPIVISNVVCNANGKYGLWVIDYAPFDLADFRVYDSSFSDCRTGTLGYGVNLYLTGSGSLATNFFMTGCTITNNNWGVYLRNNNTGASFADCRIRETFIDGNGTGVVAKVTSGTGSAAAGVNFADNSLSGNIAGVVNLDTVYTLNMPSNWWGGILGPVHVENPVGDGEVVKGLVAFNPILGSGVDSKPLKPGFQPGAANAYDVPAKSTFIRIW